jgi:hypothetical protein
MSFFQAQLTEEMVAHIVTTTLERDRAARRSRRTSSRPEPGSTTAASAAPPATTPLGLENESYREPSLASDSEASSDSSNSATTVIHTDVQVHSSGSTDTVYKKIVKPPPPPPMPSDCDKKAKGDTAAGRSGTLPKPPRAAPAPPKPQRLPSVGFSSLASAAAARGRMISQKYKSEIEIDIK